MITRVLLIMALVMMTVGARIYEEGHTEQKLNETANRIGYDVQNSTIKAEAGNQNLTAIKRGVFKVADLVLFIGLESSKAGLEYGYHNPQYNFGFMWKLLFLTLLSYLVIPSIYLFTFLFYVGVQIKNVIQKIMVKQ